MIRSLLTPFFTSITIVEEQGILSTKKLISFKSKGVDESVCRPHGTQCDFGLRSVLTEMSSLWDSCGGFA
jgi:hypothetical protein